MAKKNATRNTKDAANKRTTAQYAEQRVMTGAGGEVHQSAGGDTPVLTTQQGMPVADDQNSRKIGSAGPRRSKIFTSARSSSTSTMSASPSAWCMPAASGRVGISRTMRR
jgi:hypothetical protein